MESNNTNTTEASKCYVDFNEESIIFENVIKDKGLYVDVDMFMDCFYSTEYNNNNYSITDIEALLYRFYHRIMDKIVDKLYYKNAVISIDDLMMLPNEHLQNPYYYQSYVLWKYMEKIQHLKDRGIDWIQVMNMYEGQYKEFLDNKKVKMN